MNKMICLECGFSFNADENKECPICKTNDDKMLLKSIDFNKFQMHKLGICNDEEIRMEVKKLLDSKNHSVAYIKVCAMDLERKGFMHLALALEEIAKRKAYMEALLLEAFGMKDDFRMNMNNILIRAEQDVIHSAEIAKMAKIKNDDAIHDLMHEMAKDEASNLASLNGVLRRYLIENKQE